MEEDFLYDLKHSDSQDVITLFKTIQINEENSEYLYIAMSNTQLCDFIEEISELYIKNCVYSVFYEIIDGWIDNKCNINLYKNISELTRKISKILIKLLHSDMIECENFYIDTLNKQFKINYYAEKMVG